MVFPILGSGAPAVAYNIENSLRFNDADDAYLNRTPGSAGNRRTWTWSAWYKRGVIGTRQTFFHQKAANDNNQWVELRIGTDDKITFSWYSSGVFETSQVFRDASAWYHFVLAVDTTQGTDTNRIKFYVNGSQVTAFGTMNYPAQNYDTGMNQASASHIGDLALNGNFDLDGYLAEIYNIDGTAYAASDFGETDDDSGIWKPKNAKANLTFGTNGYYLEFKETGTSADSSGKGADTSGEDNHWDDNNLAVTDQTTDTPTNNFCTINPEYRDDGNNVVAADHSEGNTKMLTTNDGWKFGRGTFMLSSGKWYAEVKATETGNGEYGNFGIVPSQGGVALGNTDDNDVFEGIRINLSSSDTELMKLDTGSGTAVFTNFASGSTAQLAVDLDNNKIWVGHSGTWYNDNNTSSTLDSNNHDIALPTVTAGWLFGVGQSRNGSDNITWEYNWGNPPNAISSGNADANGYGNFEFAVPSGFYAVCTKNLAEFGG